MSAMGRKQTFACALAIQAVARQSTRMTPADPPRSRRTAFAVLTAGAMGPKMLAGPTGRLLSRTIVRNEHICEGDQQCTA
jgi:hypothetical protein